MLNWGEIQTHFNVLTTNKSQMKILPKSKTLWFGFSSFVIGLCVKRYFKLDTPFNVAPNNKIRIVLEK